MNYIIGDIENYFDQICLLNKSKIMKSVILNKECFFK